MPYKLISIALFAWLSMLSGNTRAAMIDITATSVDSRFTGFSLRFDDVSGDGLLQIDEVIEFSGFTLTNPDNHSVDGIYDVILGTAEIDGISSSSGMRLFARSNWNFKRFDGDPALCCSSGYWTYNSATVVLSPGAITTVPVPAAIWLFGSGILGLIGLAGNVFSHRNT
jgi:hypothetical protein